MRRMAEGATPQEESTRTGINVATIRHWRRMQLKKARDTVTLDSPDDSVAESPMDAGNGHSTPIERALAGAGVTTDPGPAPNGRVPDVVQETDGGNLTAEGLVALTEGTLGTIVVASGLLMGLSPEQIEPYRLLAPTERVMLKAMAPAALPAFQRWINSPTYAGYVYLGSSLIIGLAHSFPLLRMRQARSRRRVTEEHDNVVPISKGTQPEARSASGAPVAREVSPPRV